MRRLPSLSRLLAALAALAMTAGVVVAAPRPAAAAYPHASVDFLGHGWGHGRGMGQYGALGYALDHGWDWERILDHFYGGTTKGGLPGGDDGYGMSVRITDRDATDTILSGSVIVDQDSGSGAHAGVLVRRVGAGQYAVYYGGGCGGPWPATPNTVVNDAAVVLRPGTQNLTICLSNGTRTVHGTVRATEWSGNQITVNDLPMGLYLRGVVPRESPASWGDLGGGKGMHALRAQSVAARSYAAAENRYPGVAKTCDTISCQVYAGQSQTIGGGTISEDPRTNQAIADTAGVIRQHSNGAVARTEFSSSTGGWTAGGTFPAVIDEGDDVAQNPNHTWRVSIPVTRFEEKWPGRGQLEDVVVTRRNGLGADGGRVLEVRIEFAGGTVTTTGNDVRSKLGLRSDWFTVVNRAAFPYHAVTDDGSVYAFGGAPHHGSLRDLGVRATISGLAEGPGGYWLQGSDGGVFSFGVPFHGSMGGRHLNRPIVGMAATAAGDGYWMVGSDGGVFSFGGASFRGSTGAMHLNRPVVGMAADPDGDGYWLVATDGGIFSFSAAFHGSTGAIALNQPIFAMAATPDGQGYWLVARDGGVFSFGTATFFGSLPGRGIRETAAAIVPSPTGGGYLIATREGRIYGFGDASSAGGPADHGVSRPTVAAAAAR